MKKRLLSIIALLVALMLVVLTGCEKEVERKKDDKKSKSETTENVGDENKEDDTTEAGEGNIVEEGDDDNDGKKPASGANSGITSADDFFDDDAGKNDKEPTDYIENIVNSEDKYAADDDEEIIKSGKYIMAFRQVDVDGVVTVIRLARTDDKLAMFVDSPEEKVGMIIVGENIHMVMTDEKAYVTLPMEALGIDSAELLAEFESLSDFDGEEEPAKVYTEVVDGVEYTVHENEEGLKSYFIGNKVIMGETEDGGMMYIDELTGTVPASVFEVPSGYRELTIFEFAEMMQ